MFKVQQELSFVYNPIEFSNMIKNPMPVIGLVNDGVKIITNTFDELLLDPIFGEERLLFGGTVNDKTPFGSQSIKVLPGAPPPENTGAVIFIVAPPEEIIVALA